MREGERARETAGAGNITDVLKVWVFHPGSWWIALVLAAQWALLVPLSSLEIHLPALVCALLVLGLFVVRALLLALDLEMVHLHFSATATLGGLGMALGSRLDALINAGPLCRDPSAGPEQWLFSGMMLGMLLACVPACLWLCRKHHCMASPWRGAFINSATLVAMVVAMVAAHAIDSAYPHYLLRDPVIHHIWMVLFMAFFSSLAFVVAVGFINGGQVPVPAINGRETEER